MTTIVWLRDDLRIADNPALRAAVDRGSAVIPVYLLDEVSPGIRPLGGASRWWLHQSLADLGARFAGLGSPLILRRGAAATVIPQLVAETGADAVLWNRRYGGAEREVDTALKASLRETGIVAESHAASLLFEPWTIRTGGGTPYSVFTPFWRACRAEPAPREPLAAPGDLTAPTTGIASDDLDSWQLEPTRPDWAGGLRESWTPGEESAAARLLSFLDDELGDYDDGRDTPSADVTSRLSPHLRFGEISPHQIWHEAIHRSGSAKFLSELGWREFAWHVLFHFPDLQTKNWRSEFDAFPWPPLDGDALAAWQQGRTGYPMVDAGMRELWHTGTMHNRVRMIVASFLTKNLLIDWREGEEWFWDTLVDADTAANAFNWQWVAGSGADAAPYFRVFNPELQAKKFDPQRAYITHWVPECASDSLTPPAEPIVDLGESRRAALAAYDRVKRAPSTD